MVSHRIIISGGGTGGHIYPALAVAEQLIESPDLEDILYIGAVGHREEKLADARKLPFRGLTVSGLPRRISLELFGWPLEFARAVMASVSILRQFKPTAVLGTGGYASAPPLVAANLIGIPYAIHEPDAHPGLVNRLFSLQAALVSCGMEEAVNALKVRKGRLVVNGNPVGKSFLNLLPKSAACAVFGLNPELKTVLITGGSQGAQAINEAVFQALPELLAAEPKIQIIHQVGDKNLGEFRENIQKSGLLNERYFLRNYFDDLSLPYAIADLAVCRSGAMTIAELAVTGCPSIFVPYPYAAADHQKHNALYMQSKGAAVVIDQSQLSGETLKKQILELLAQPDKLEGMSKAMRLVGKPQAAADLAEQLKEMSTNFQLRA